MKNAFHRLSKKVIKVTLYSNRLKIPRNFPVYHRVYLNSKPLSFFLFQERFGERISNVHLPHVGAAPPSGDFDARHDSAAHALQRNLSSDSFHMDREVSAMFHQNTIIARL